MGTTLTISALSPPRWRDKHTYLSSLGMLGTTQLTHFICRSHNVNNGYMKRAHTRQRMSNNNNNSKRKQV